MYGKKKMNNANNESQGIDAVCKNHTARSERDLYRICPSKLSKRELENLYFALLENNVDLKKTVHSQQEKLKVLSTKVQRMTVQQRTATGKEKNCCTSKVLALEQKDIIAELKKANERMSDKISLLNMRLCSAKQFLKRSPSQSSKCVKSGTAPSTFKNSSTSALSSKLSENLIIMPCINASCQYNKAKNDAESSKIMQTFETETGVPEKDDVESSKIMQRVEPGVLEKDDGDSSKIMRRFETETGEPEKYDVESSKIIRRVDTETGVPEKCDTENLCVENRCRSVMDELKQKIVNLQEELSQTHDEYSMRISKLESDVSALRDENVRVRGARVAGEHALQRQQQRADQLTAQLREVEGKINDLTMQLTIEKRKVTELDTALRLAKSSNKVIKTIEKLKILNDKIIQVEADMPRSGSLTAKQPDAEVATSPKKDLASPSSSPKSKEEIKYSKSDDSGYTDLNKSSETEEDKVMVKLNQEMLKRICQLQSQLDGLRIKTAGESVQKTQETKDYDSFDSVTKDLDDVERDNMVIPSGAQDEQNNEKLNEGYSQDQKYTSTPIKDSDSGVTESEIKQDITSRRPWEDFGRHKIRMDEASIKSETSSFLPQNRGELKIGQSNKVEDSQRYQIPGPVPTSPTTCEDKKKLFKTSKSNSKEDKSIRTSVKINDNSKDNIFYDLKKDDETDKANKDETKNKAQEKPRKKSITLQLKEEEIPDSLAEENFVQSPKRDSIIISRKRLTSKNPFADSMFDAKPINTQDLTSLSNSHKTSTSSYFCPTEERVRSVDQPDSSHADKPTAGAGKVIQTACTKTIEEYAETQLEKEQAAIPVQKTFRDSATIAHIAAQPARRDSATFTATAVQPIRRDSVTYTGMAVQPSRRNSATYTATAGSPARRDSATYTAPADQTAHRNIAINLDTSVHKSTGTSTPDNTEHEISSLSDLPPEKDGKSPRVLSPGEQMTPTRTDTDTGHTTDYYCSLSEGELPQSARDVRSRKLSFGENPTSSHVVPQEQMEATLQAIGEELSRCRQLLVSSRCNEVLYCSRVT